MPLKLFFISTTFCLCESLYYISYIAIKNNCLESIQRLRNNITHEITLHLKYLFHEVKQYAE